MYYNFARPHITLTKAHRGYRTTPAMAAGVTDHVWTRTDPLPRFRPLVRKEGIEETVPPRIIGKDVMT